MPKRKQGSICSKNKNKNNLKKNLIYQFFFFFKEAQTLIHI